VHEPGAVEQNIDRAGILGGAIDVGGVQKFSFAMRIASDARSRNFASSTSVAITRAPAAAKASAVARPIPCPAAVTNAVLPCKMLVMGVSRG
jgi:hypothetical protein